MRLDDVRRQLARFAGYQRLPRGDALALIDQNLIDGARDLDSYRYTKQGGDISGRDHGLDQRAPLDPIDRHCRTRYEDDGLSHADADQQRYADQQPFVRPKKITDSSRCHDAPALEAFRRRGR